MLPPYEIIVALFVQLVRAGFDPHAVGAYLARYFGLM